MKLEYTKDICGNDILQDETGKHQVMMAWEKPYMEACVEKLDISGSVLEIGFGMGYSARKICSSPHITDYTVIECCPAVWEKVEEYRKEFPELPIHLVKGRWQDVLYTCGKYDRCFFDDYLPDTTSTNRFSKFLNRFIVNHANINCKINSFSTAYQPFQKNGFITVTSEHFPIQIPKYCNYAKGNKMYVYVMTKNREPTEEEKAQLLKNHTPQMKFHGGTITLAPKTTFTAVTGSRKNIRSAAQTSLYNEIADIYHQKGDMKIMDTLCREYIQHDILKDRQFYMVKFFQAYSNFHSDPKKSKKQFTVLANMDTLDTDIKDWVSHNLSLL